MTPTADTALGVSVAVVSFNTKGHLERCLESVLAARPERVVVVDNRSSDGSVDLVRERFPSVCVIANDANVGYGAAANQAVQACSSPVVLLLNSDTRIAPDTLAALAEYLGREPNAVIVGPRLVSSDGQLQRSAYPFPHTADTLLGETGLHLVIRRLPWVRDRYLRTWRHDRPRRVPWVLGAALALRRSSFETLGGFDSEYFLYFEETDLCRRANALAMETHFAPVTTVVHEGGASTRHDVTGARRQLITSMKRYVRRHESTTNGRRLLRTMRIISAARLLRDAARMLATRAVHERTERRRALRSATALVRDRELWQL